jgi:hypothetical protein
MMGGELSKLVKVYRSFSFSIYLSLSLSFSIYRVAAVQLNKAPLGQ